MSQPTATAGRGSRVFTILASATIITLSGVFAFANESTPPSASIAETPSVSSTFSADLTRESSSGTFGVGTSASSSSGGGGAIQLPSTGN